MGKIQVVYKRSSAFRFRTPDNNSPMFIPANILDKIFNLLDRHCSHKGSVILREKPELLIERNSSVTRFLARKTSETLTKKKLIKEVIIFLVEHGGLIHTDKTKMSYIFDEEQFEIIRRTARERKSFVVSYDVQSRLEELLGQKKKKADKSTTGPLRKVLTTDLTENLSGLLEEFPETASLITEVVTLASQSARLTSEKELSGTSLALAVNLKKLVENIRSKIENETLDLLTGDIPVVTEGKDSQNGVCNIAGKRNNLQDQMEPINKELQQIRNIQIEVQDDIETIEDIIYDLEERSRIGTPDEKRKLKVALTRAETSREQMTDYLAEIADIREPLDESLMKINRQLNALGICASQPEAIPTISKELSTPPEFDEDEMRDWKSISTKTVKAKPATVVDYTNLSAEQKLVIAVLQLVGRRSSMKIANALEHVGLMPKVEKTFTFVTDICYELTNTEPPIAHYGGKMSFGWKHYHFFTLCKEIHLPDLDQILSDDVQEKIINFFKSD